MTRLSAVLRNTGYLAFAETAKPALSFVLILVIARTLGRDGMGSYTIILTFTSLFELIATFGVGTLIVRGIASHPDQFSFYANGAIGVAIVATAIVTPVMLIALHAFNYPPDISLGIRLLAWTLLVSILQQYALSLCEGLQNMRLRAVISVADTAGRLITGVFMVLQGHGVLGVVEGIVVVRAITTLLAFIAIAHHTGFSVDYRGMFRSSGKFAVAGLPFLFTAIASAAAWSVNTLMLSKLSSVSEVGTYNAASRITDIIKTFLFSYQIALLPMMSASFINSREQFRRDCNTSIKYLALLTVPMATGISVLASRIIGLVFGIKFAPAVPVLQVLAWTVCVFSVAMVFARVLIASHHQMLDLYCNLAALVVNVSLGWVLIRSYGPVGAGISTLISLSAFGLLEYLFVAKKLFTAEVLVPIARAAGASAIMGFCLFHLKAVPLFLVIPLGALLYSAVLICTGTFSPAELRTARVFVAERIAGMLARREKSAVIAG
jgi:O-antigen/teichoic acid export membrane protein